MAITFKGNPITLAGEFVKVGTHAPEFILVDENLKEYKLSDWKGNYLILNIFPSLDTSVCGTSVRRFNKIGANLPNTTVLCISKDLPFAQSRFCAIEGLNNVIPLSDFRYTSDFGDRYGVLMTSGPLKGLLARAVVIINHKKEIIYSELVNEVTHEPNYDEAIKIIAE